MNTTSDKDEKIYIVVLGRHNTAEASTERAAGTILERVRLCFGRSRRTHALSRIERCQERIDVN